MTDKEKIEKIAADLIRAGFLESFARDSARHIVAETNGFVGLCKESTSEVIQTAEDIAYGNDI